MLERSLPSDLGGLGDSPKRSMGVTRENTVCQSDSDHDMQLKNRGRGRNYVCLATSFFIPESCQLQAWILQGSWEQLQAWVTWMIVTQIQLSQMAGVTAQSWGQGSTAFLCNQTARQTTNTWGKQANSNTLLGFVPLNPEDFLNPSSNCKSASGMRYWPVKVVDLCLTHDR